MVAQFDKSVVARPRGPRLQIFFVNSKILHQSCLPFPIQKPLPATGHAGS
jgi:hypothetical protein